MSTDSLSPTQKIVAWAAAAGTILGLITTVYHLYGPARDQFVESAQTKAAIQQAQAQYEDDDYAGAYQAYSELLKAQPGNKTAAEGRLQAAMARVRNYSVSGAADDGSVAARAGAELTGIIQLLEPAAAEARGSRASEATAHLGWAHFLRFRIARSDVFESAEPYLRKACALDSGNVYANAMLGNWMLQNHRGSLREAAAYLHTAIEHSGNDSKGWARRFQIGALAHNDEPGAHAELARVANEMRKNGEPLDDNLKHDALAIYAPSVTGLAEWDDALSAAPLAEMWATYQWLADGGDGAETDWKRLKGQLNLARMEELAGQRQEALAHYRQIERDPKARETVLAGMSKDGLQRLKKAAPKS